MGQGISTRELAHTKYRLLLVGITGSGKSSLANAILGTKDLFKQATGMLPVTSSCQLERVNRDGIELEVVDTPGFCDQGETNDNIHATIAQFLLAVSPGPHAVLIVMKATERYTKDADIAYAEAKKLLGAQNLASRIVLVFTGGDVITNVVLEAQINSTYGKLSKMKQEAGDRYVLFNNKATGRKNTEQLITLLKKVQEACMQVQEAGACNPDLTFLSNKIQIQLETIISNESEIKSKNEQITIEEARFRLRQAMARANRDDEALQRAIALVLKAMTTQKVDVSVRLCTVL